MKSNLLSMTRLRCEMHELLCMSVLISNFGVYTEADAAVSKF